MCFLAENGLMLVVILLIMCTAHPHMFRQIMSGLALQVLKQTSLALLLSTQIRRRKSSL